MTSHIKKFGKIKGDIRRDQIVRASFKIIGEKGIGSLTTAAIAREVGISEANLYRHFKNKAEIYFAAVVHVRDMITLNLEKAFLGGAAPLTVLKRFFVFQISLMEKNSGIPRFMFSEEMHIHKNMRGKILETIYAVSVTLASLIRAGQKTGSIRKDIDPKTTALMFIGTVQGLAFQWSLGGFSFSLAAQGMKTWKNFETCIALKKYPKRRSAR